MAFLIFHPWPPKHARKYGTWFAILLFDIPWAKKTRTREYKHWDVGMLESALGHGKWQPAILSKN